MDSDESEDELYPIETIYPNRGGEAFIYNDPLLVTGVLRAIVTEDLEKIKELVSAGHSLNINDNNGNTPLHVAVIKNNSQIVRYLLSQDDSLINTRNFFGETALFLAVRYGQFELTKILIESGTNVNLPDNSDVTPLHKSVQYPDLVHLLIRNGAILDVNNCVNDKPLHDAVAKNCVESVCMLLYYGADANALGNFNLTPFMKAVVKRNVEIQEILFEYIDDYNVNSLHGCNLLSLVLKHESPFVEEIIKRGGEVDVNVVKTSVKLTNLDIFKLVWNQPKTEKPQEFNLLLYIYYKSDNTSFSSYLDIILEASDSTFFENITENLFSYDAYSLFVFYLLTDSSTSVYLNKEKICQLICLLLEYGFKLDTESVMMIYKTMGYCDLLKILLYMDCDFNWSPTYDIIPRLLFDIHCDIESIYYLLKAAKIVMNNCMLKNIENSLKYWVYTPLIDMVVNDFFIFEFIFMEKEDRVAYRKVIGKRFSNIPKVPSLLQLARDKTRKYIVDKFKIKSTCQFYTFINHLEMSTVYKKILSLETPIYELFEIH